MAKFDALIPEELMNQFSKLSKDTDKMLGEMTKAGAEVAYDNILSNIPPNFANSDIMNCLKITRVYKTPSDEGINTKVGFYGYFTNKNGVKTPAPLVANVFEYGKSGFNKRPFFRKSFKKAQITSAMMKVQNKYIKGD